MCFHIPPILLNQCWMKISSLRFRKQYFDEEAIRKLAKVVVDACHCLDIGVAGNINGNVLFYVRPAGMPLARALELLYADYIRWTSFAGYSSKCLKFTPDRLHTKGTHIHINGSWVWSWKPIAKHSQDCNGK